mmetsp:Transcript_47496/g.76222  ORF Transcript_47496/g.76222 Transcript_47496/m.76222 type:complete len:224 (-) Transcript_47496:8-679(-)
MPIYRCNSLTVSADHDITVIAIIYIFDQHIIQRTISTRTLIPLITLLLLIGLVRCIRIITEIISVCFGIRHFGSSHRKEILGTKTQQRNDILTVIIIRILITAISIFHQFPDLLARILVIIQLPMFHDKILSNRYNRICIIAQINRLYCTIMCIPFGQLCKISGFDIKDANISIFAAHDNNLSIVIKLNARNQRVQHIGLRHEIPFKLAMQHRVSRVIDDIIV